MKVYTTPFQLSTNVWFSGEKPSSQLSDVTSYLESLSGLKIAHWADEFSPDDLGEMLSIIYKCRSSIKKKIS